jgi:hypothetical protein
MSLITGSLQPSTYAQYDRHWRAFAAYCALNNESALPASSATVVRYAASLAATHTLQPESFRPISSAINKAHEEVGLPAPAQGEVLTALIRGWKLHRHTTGGQQAERAPLPATVASRALDAALALCNAQRLAQQPFEAHEAQHIRTLVASALCFATMARSDTDLHLQRTDVEITESTIFIRLRKAKGKAVSALQRRLSIPLNAISGLADIIRHWQQIQLNSYTAARRTLPQDLSFWRLASDTASWTSSSAVLDSWLQAACHFLHEQAPLGDKWLSHSFRKGAASAAHAVQVSLINICWHGGWATKSAAVHLYITPVPADAAAYRFFGWLRPQAPPAT